MSVNKKPRRKSATSAAAVKTVAKESSADMAVLAKAARQAARVLEGASTAKKNDALNRFAAALAKHQAELRRANAADMAAAKKAGLSAPLLDRLFLDKKRIGALAEGVLRIADLPDPVGEMGELRRMPSGIQVGKMRAPIGVILMIYESRPAVGGDAAALCVKSGNAVILRGGSEARRSNAVIARLFSQSAAAAGLPAACAQCAPPDRAAIGQLLAMEKDIDLVVPRGGRGLVERVDAEARMPSLKHLDGNCHIFLDESAPEKRAVDIVVNAKTRRYGVCNALESLLAHKNSAARLLPLVARALKKHKVELRGCPQTQKILSAKKIACAPATEADYRAEYLAPILSVRVVAGLDEAIAHINKYGSQHTDSIVTENIENAGRFLREVDSASVMVNASTAFADGFEYGLGGEIGISTGRLHARGPVGLEGLTTQKFVVLGEGHTRP